MTKSASWSFCVNCVGEVTEHGEPAEVVLWYPKDQIEALAAILKENGSSVEQELEKALNDLYVRMVSESQRKGISEKQAVEEQREQEQCAQQAAASYRVSAIRLVHDGQAKAWQLDRAWDVLEVAKILRSATRQDIAETQQKFLKALGEKEPIGEVELLLLAKRRLENDIHVQGVFTVDFDRQQFGFVDPETGWKEYAAKDIRAAVWHAIRKNGIPKKIQMRRFLSLLELRRYSVRPV